MSVFTGRLNSWATDSHLTPAEGSIYSGLTCQSICCTAESHTLHYFQTCVYAWTPIPSLQSSIVAKFSRNKWRLLIEDSVRPIWRTGMVRNNNFCTFLYGLHECVQVWMDYFETVVTRRGTTGARTSVPSYLSSSVSQMRLEWSENTREVSWLGLGVSG